MKKLFFIAITLCIVVTIQAQDVETYAEAPLKRNSLYFELGGNSLLYSLNFDHLIPFSNSLKLAVGGGFEYVTDIKINDVSYGASTCLTPSANLLLGRTSHHFETGVSCFVPLSAGIALPAVRLGYRYQPRNGGFLFRIGATPFITPGGILPWGGLSFGFSL
ncbi:MAG: hypothetical protein GX102_06630 [Porphyromonadaceae bacterium]|jgi:hypothetical protein|nr:hypothetical protein [Porphyromonadaceae bacterium]